MPELPVVVQKAYELNVWLIEKVQRFPRSHRFGVGDRLLQGVLDVLLKLVDAVGEPAKRRLQRREPLQNLRRHASPQFRMRLDQAFNVQQILATLAGPALRILCCPNFAVQDVLDSRHGKAQAEHFPHR